jgi:hypothetical protein
MQQRQKKITLMTMSLPTWCSQEKERKAFCPGSVLSLSSPPHHPHPTTTTTTTLVCRACCCCSTSLHLCARSSVSLCLRKRRRHASSRAPRCVVVVGGAPRPGSDRTRPTRGWASRARGTGWGGGGGSRTPGGCKSNPAR